jgi:hypothetical protein
MHWLKSATSPGSGGSGVLRQPPEKMTSAIALVSMAYLIILMAVYDLMNLLTILPVGVVIFRK